KPIKPIASYQVYNEPTLQKYFPSSDPVHDYATLLGQTAGVIRSTYPSATVVLAGLPGVIAKRPLGWRFLTHLYGVPGFRRHFDVAAFQPYSHDGTELKYQMNKFRTVMKRHGDKLKQLWVTEFGFGSAPHTGD